MEKIAKPKGKGKEMKTNGENSASEGETIEFNIPNCDASIIKNIGPMERKKALTNDIPAVIRVIRMAQTMSDVECNYFSEVESLRREKEAWEARELELQNNFNNYKEMHKIQVGLVEELETKTQMVENLTIDRDSLLEEVKILKDEKSKVEDVVKVAEELARKVKVLEKKKVELGENISLLKNNGGSSDDGPYAGMSRQDLIENIEELQEDVLSFLRSTF